MFSDLYDPAPQGRHSRRPGEEESDVDIEGFEEEDDGKPKTPAPVRKRGLLESHAASTDVCGYMNKYCMYQLTTKYSYTFMYSELP